QNPRRNPEIRAPLRFLYADGNVYRHHHAARPRSPQQIHHRPPYPRAIHRQPAPACQFVPLRHLDHPLHHVCIRRPPLDPLQVPHLQTHHLLPRVHHRVPRPRRLRPLQHRNRRKVPALSEIHPNEIPVHLSSSAIRLHLVQACLCLSGGTGFSLSIRAILGLPFLCPLRFLPTLVFPFLSLLPLSINLVFASLRFSPRSLRLRVEPTPSLSGTPPSPNHQRLDFIRDRALHQLPREYPAQRVLELAQVLLPEPPLPHRGPLLIQMGLPNPRAFRARRPESLPFRSAVRPRLIEKPALAEWR